MHEQPEAERDGADEYDTDLRLHYDYLFHYAMGRAARNDLLAYYQHQILEQLVTAMHDYLTDEEDLSLVVDLHQRTLAALRGSKRRIDAVMDEHLRFFERAVEERTQLNWTTGRGGMAASVGHRR